jgi:hypothetical protein
MRLTLNLATLADDAAIRALLRREPMPGWVKVTFEREPDFWLGCKVTGEDCHTLVARDEESGEVVGVVCLSTRNVFLNGNPQRIGYIGLLRVDSRYRGLGLTLRGFSEMRKLHDLDPLPAYLAAIVVNNNEATGVLERSRREGLLAFRAIADIRILAIAVNRARPVLHADGQISPPHAGQLADVARFLEAHGSRRQLSPVWTEESLAQLAAFGLGIDDFRIAWRDGQIAGVAALWDQHSFKQTVVRSYAGWLSRALPIYNLIAPWLGRVALPQPGEMLRNAYAALICVANDEPGVFRALLRELYNCAHSRGLTCILVGLDSRDPLLPVACEYAHVVYPMRLYFAEWPDGNRIDQQLDERLAYVDIATL